MERIAAEADEVQKMLEIQVELGGVLGVLGSVIEKVHRVIAM